MKDCGMKMNQLYDHPTSLAESEKQMIYPTITLPASIVGKDCKIDQLIEGEMQLKVKRIEKSSGREVVTLEVRGLECSADKE